MKLDSRKTKELNFCKNRNKLKRPTIKTFYIINSLFFVSLATKLAARLNTSFHHNV